MRMNHFLIRETLPFKMGRGPGDGLQEVTAGWVGRWGGGRMNGEMIVCPGGGGASGPSFAEEFALPLNHELPPILEPLESVGH